jgi:hypothetical protein
MTAAYLFEKATELKDKFKSLFQHKKKIAALENYSMAASFTHRNQLVLIKNCVNDGFLDEEETRFLEYMLKKYELNYLDWSHKTKWLKNQIRNMAGRKPTENQFFFNWNKQPKQAVEIPLELVSAAKSQMEMRF